jgi:hypothetical protein
MHWKNIIDAMYRENNEIDFFLKSEFVKIEKSKEGNFQLDFPNNKIYMRLECQPYENKYLCSLYSITTAKYKYFGIPNALKTGKWKRKDNISKIIFDEYCKKFGVQDNTFVRFDGDINAILYQKFISAEKIDNILQKSEEMNEIIIKNKMDEVKNILLKNKMVIYGVDSPLKKFLLPHIYFNVNFPRKYGNECKMHDLLFHKLEGFLDEYNINYEKEISEDYKKCYFKFTKIL